MLPLGLIAPLTSLASTAVGMVGEAKNRAQMQQMQNKWGADNETLYNKNYYGDYTQRSDTQNIIKQMRDQMTRQDGIDKSTAAITGSTPEVAIANKDQRNRNMSNLFGNLAAQGQQFKDNAQNNYLNRKQQLEGMQYDTLAGQAQSGNNLMYNGLKGAASTDWAGMLSNNHKGSYLPIPQTGVTVNGGPVVPDKIPGIN